MKTLLPYSPKGGYAGFVSLSEAAVSADTHAFARLPPGGLRKKRNGGFCGENAPGFWVGRAPWRPGPQAPGACTANFLLRLKYHITELYSFHERRGSRLRSSISAAGPAPRVWGPGQQAPEPCIRQPSRIKNSKNAPVLIGS